MRLECDKYQGGQFLNLERHLSMLLSFFLCDICAVTFFPWNCVSPSPAFPLYPILLQYPLISFLLLSVFFFWPSSFNFILLSFHLSPSSPLLLFIFFHPHTLVFWLLHFWQGNTLLLCLMIFIRADCGIMCQAVNRCTSGHLWNMSFWLYASLFLRSSQ